MERVKARTPQGALLELTRLTQEKMHLREEVARWDQSRRRSNLFRPTGT